MANQGTLKQLFLDIYIPNQQHKAIIVELWANQGWNLTYRRLSKDPEIGRSTEFKGTLEQFKEVYTSIDYLTWQGKFIVNSAYKEFNFSANWIGCWP